jgi:hypothetical protein
VTRVLVYSLLFAALAYSQSPPQSPTQSPPPAHKSFWKILVTPNAKWTLTDTVDKARSKILVETYDVRKVGAADVARLRWTHLINKKDHNDWGDSDSGRYTQVAVTDAGLYILSADMDDAKIADALKKKPSRSDPPKPYKGTKQNQGRYLHFDSSTLRHRRHIARRRRSSPARPTAKTPASAKSASPPRAVPSSSPAPGRRTTASSSSSSQMGAGWQVP